ncbi:MAG: NAD(P)/FAD-dependent oxidoreductase [Deltaproteobacteria bacterium]|jgi:sulfide:quinone oxidoreductase|nr:NAD(P)/FAD-dependent oxidoreductase [Deltaproteobacteria bacterium]MBW2215269.1 NAD(P)/FAD-dependent oxidoreductase [Deltaproteobacteria bacterium]MBW2380880.1 NAD(P)/FAD-dependent oxidoreductase [Deltaproteobacteria bacterium]MBW2687775.1 NAD(P)/FAD-dependent oxidoreductase [Deltaproteobacteria bacterium]
MSEQHDVLIVGGGTAGITVAAQLLNQEVAPKVTIVEPSTTHDYQPIWTLVGGGVFPREVSRRPMADVMPRGATWIRDRIVSFEPEKNEVQTESGKTLAYNELVVGAGIQLNWDAVKGLPEAIGKGGVCSNYGYDKVPYTWESIQAFQGGNAVFTYPATPIKCAGAPQKIMYLAEETFRRRGIREQANVIYASATAGIFGVPKYAEALNKVVADRNIQTQFAKNLVEIRPQSREAVFKDVNSGEELVLKYDMMHVTPPQGAPNFIKQSALADEAGWVGVDKHTLQHTKFPNVFALGDCSSLPCSKTGAAVRKQAPVLVQNVIAFRAEKPLSARYEGYASCPLVTGYGKVILAEFGYDGVIMETFPFDQAKERYSMYALKAYGLPSMYWHGMLQGRG